MHARVLPNGDIEVGVHIADVTYFVSHNSPLDQEAKVRGTTFYLVDRRFDMLPTLLSSDLCSLHGNMDRLTVSTIWTFSRDLKVVKDFWFGRTVIHNCQAMTYEQAHNILHDLPPDNPSKDPPPPLTAGYPVHRNNIKILKEELIVLTKLARQLRKDREDIGGAVDLSSGDQGNELKFSFDENGNPVQILPKKQLEIHHTIAELMVCRFVFCFSMCSQYVSMCNSNCFRSWQIPGSPELFVKGFPAAPCSESTKMLRRVVLRT
jgi:DIS3-like exonuclease 1